jgi:hypothetical protein
MVVVERGEHIDEVMIGLGRVGVRSGEVAIETCGRRAANARTEARTLENMIMVVRRDGGDQSRERDTHHPREENSKSNTKGSAFGKVSCCRSVCLTDLSAHEIYLRVSKSPSEGESLRTKTGKNNLSPQSEAQPLRNIRRSVLFFTGICVHVVHPAQ